MAQPSLTLKQKVRVGSPVHGVGISANVERLAAASESGLFTFDGDGHPSFSMRVQGGDLERPFNAIALTPDGKVLVAGTRLGDLYHIELPEPKNYRPWLRGIPERIHSLAISDDGRLIVIGHVAERLSAVKERDTYLWTRKPHFKTWHVSLSKDGTQVLAASLGSVGGVNSTANGVFLLDATSGDSTTSHRTNAVVTAILLSGGTPQPLVAESRGTYENTLTLFSQDFLQRDWIYESEVAFTCLAGDEQGKYIIAGANDGSAYLFDFGARKIIDKFSVPNYPLTSAAMTQDGRYIALGCVDGFVYILRNELIALDDDMRLE